MTPTTHRPLVTRVLSEALWPASAAEELASNAHVIIYEKDNVIFHAGESADLLYVLLSGEAKLYYTRPTGDRLLAEIVPGRALLGCMHPASRPQSEPAQRFSAEALSRCTVALITRSRVAAVAATLSAVELAHVAGHLAEQWARLSERAFDYLMLDVRGRLAMAITSIAERFGIPDGRGTLLPLRLTHEDFGELVGASRPMVSRHLKELADAGIFYKHGGRYILAQRDALQRDEERPPTAARVRPATPREWRTLRAVQTMHHHRHDAPPLRKVAR